jgi:hypothetical protein
MKYKGKNKEKMVRELEKTMGMPLNGIAWFLANNPPIKSNERDKR